MQPSHAHASQSECLRLPAKSTSVDWLDQPRNSRLLYRPSPWPSADGLQVLEANGQPFQGTVRVQVLAGGNPLLIVEPRLPFPARTYVELVVLPAGYRLEDLDDSDIPAVQFTFLTSDELDLEPPLPVEDIRAYGVTYLPSIFLACGDYTVGAVADATTPEGFLVGRLASDRPTDPANPWQDVVDIADSYFDLWFGRAGAETTLPDVHPGQFLEIQVAAMDEAGNLSEWSEPVVVHVCGCANAGLASGSWTLLLGGLFLQRRRGRGG